MHIPERAIVAVVGPTAVGKTETALRMAEALNAEVISVDSRLFYRGMDIGTAKPTAEERARVPHHLIDVAEPDEVWSLAVFQQAAQQAIAEVHARGRLPLLVGGTGQYLRAVMEGWEPPTTQPDARLRAALEAWGQQIGAQALHERLAVVDPAAAAGIDFTNVRRTVRALEVVFQSGRRFSEQRGRGPSPYTRLTIGLRRPRAELYARIDQRIEQMVADGLLEEVRGLLSRGYGADLPTLSAIGYREMAEVVRGEITLEEAVVQMKRQTRVFVRRQANWFKESDPNIHWFTAQPGVESEILAWLAADPPWLSAGT